MLETLWQNLQAVHYLTALAVAALLAVLEWRWPRRQGTPSTRRQRWGVNLGLYGLGVTLLWALMDAIEPAAIRIGSLPGWGGLAATALPDAIKIAVGVLLLDAIQYGLHRLSHSIPLLWRLHQVHHADTHLDVSSAVRHHPLEALALAALSLLLCAALGVPLLSLLIYSLIALPLALFCHANLALPVGLDRWLRWFVVTPDMHRVHHAAHLGEGNSNFGMVFPWWDQLLRSYQSQPHQGHEEMHLGLVPPARSGHGLWSSIVQPFSQK